MSEVPLHLSAQPCRYRHTDYGYRGTSLIRNCHLLEPFTELYIVPCGGPRGGAVSYERGTPMPAAL